MNISGLIHLTNIILPIMQKQKDGIIVNISSGAGKRGGAKMAVYSATKFAVIGFTQSLAQEVEKNNIRVYAVCPGTTATEMGDYTGIPPEKVARRIIKCVKEELGLSPGEDTEIYW
ncbi:SDR family NAD(P)-dependent oxidoreductase [Candidatus Microgenomates bacterium]|nr:SDR family NAD(P)-dependent oxidoreductase [Candidatus Microgenomates bacterium]